MIVIADENIPFAEEAFADLGAVRLLPGRAMIRADLAEAELLFVRSITKVNAELLEGTPVRFVGTATIGTDHIDQAWLAGRGIGFSAAPGCNAESVAQYLAAALALCAAKLGRPLPELRLGIVGHGNCGTRVERVARALGMDVLLNDPPKARGAGEASGGAGYVALEALRGCDIVTLHVPLTKEGPDKTVGLIGEDFMAALPKGAIVINACRGGVVDEAALARLLDSGRLGGAILDVWEGEPEFDPAMLDRVMIGTPHIAGYSFDGKVNGTTQVYEAAMRHLGLEAGPLNLPMPPAPVPRIELSTAGRTDDSILAELVLTACPLLRDHYDMKLWAQKAADRGRAFDLLRKQYPVRREFSATTVKVEGAGAELMERIGKLRFGEEE